MLTAAQIEALPAKAYLDPSLFVTGWGKSERLATEQYEKGLSVGREFDEVHIAVNGVWGASKPGSHLSSSEKIGYHAATDDLLRGFLDSGVAIIVHRWHGKITTTRIK